jgi:AcrR family transcriptional regulator
MDVMSSAQPRSQEERSEETRARVLEAAVACIAEDGFARTNLGRIAARAGLTTGAIQHQFGDKAALLASVVERGFGHLAEGVAQATDAGGELEDRVRAVVDAVWGSYDAAYTRASLEILLALRADPAFQQPSLKFLSRVRERIDRMWMGLFWDLGIPRAKHVAAQRLLLTTLNGLALERIVVPGMPDPSDDLARLAAGVATLLAQTAESSETGRRK